MSRQDQNLAKSVINWPPGSGSESQDYGCADPIPIRKKYLRICNTDKKTPITFLVFFLTLFDTLV
jgi:hypothetical protein